MPHEFVRPFHFWCQKVLPLVFDDSLSYYEVLAKMRDCLNNAIVEINSIGGEFEGVKNQLTQLKTYVDGYFTGLDVNQAISDKLDDMVESGEMDAVITPIFASYANPIFVASVADMIATNFAYANYENNKIYTFNRSTWLYQTTGKEFGGVVSSVGEMEDNDKYYALDSNGMLYSYDFPQAAFVETGLTYGGYRYGVNAMRPVGNTYVLTTDNHVYTWNGAEYADTGVVYGLAQTAFTWRRALTASDNFTTLNEDGWYSFKSDSIPSDKPSNMQSSDGYAIVFTNPNTIDNSSNLQSNNARNLQTQLVQNLRANSLNKRVIIKTYAGGSWCWNGENWISENEIGFPVCQDCNSVDYNSVLTVNNETANKPATGIIKTFITNNVKGQLLFTNNSVWFRYGNGEWNEAVTEAEQRVNLERFELTNLRITLLANTVNENNEERKKDVVKLESDLATVKSATTQTDYSLIKTENDEVINAENNLHITAASLVQKTDDTLSMRHVAADSEATGFEIDRLDADIDNLSDTVERNYDNAIKHSDKLDAKTNAKFDTAFESITIKGSVRITAQNGVTISCENEDTILAFAMLIATDSTLKKEGIPADSKAVGNAIEKIYSTITSNNEEINHEINSLTAISEITITSEDNYQILTEERAAIIGNIKAIKTDKTLTLSNVPADSGAVGDAIAELHDKVLQPALFTITAENGATILTIANTAIGVTEIALITDKTLTLSNVPADSGAVGDAIAELRDKVLQPALFAISAENGATILTNGSVQIMASLISIKTDKTLTLPNIPADAQAVGDALKQVNVDVSNFTHVWGVSDSHYVTTVDLIGTLPLTKNYVDMTCIIVYNNAVLYSGSCQAKIQGDSSVNNPEKNYTLKFPNNITIYGYTNKTWNIKCNYIDTSQIRNLLGARIWHSLNEGYVNEPNTNCPYNGGSYGEICYVSHNGQFHGVYTLQMSKSKYMFGITQSENAFALSMADNWGFTRLNSLDDFDRYLEIEESTDDITKTTAMNAINSWIDSWSSVNTSADFMNLTTIDPINCIKYYLLALFINHRDGVTKNINLVSYNGGQKIYLLPWDMDSTFGNAWRTTTVYKPERMNLRGNAFLAKMETTIPQEIKEHYATVSSKLTQESLFVHINDLSNTLSMSLLDADLRKWGSKGKGYLSNPLSILLWNSMYYPIAVNKITAL